MRQKDFIRLLQDNPIVAAAKDIEGLDDIQNSRCKIVFILFGDIVNISGMVSRMKDAGKMVFVHVDLIDGLAPRPIAADYIVKNTDADGIISTKSNIIKHAKSLGLLSVQRFFILDSISMENICNQITSESADAIEVLPGLMPKIIRRLVKLVEQPIITGGLIMDKEDVINALSAGASAISSSNKDIWKEI